MIKNRLFALIFRLTAFVVAIVGIIKGSGFTNAKNGMLFYTQQSNLLAIALFFVLIIYTIKDIFRLGIRGSACYFARFSYGCALVIFYTLIIFWTVLAPFAPSRLRLLSAGNLIVHTFTPLASILNCVLFCNRGQIKKRDVGLWALMPCFYVAFSLTLGFLGVEFYCLDGTSHHFPYYFMDFEFVGWYAIVFIFLIGLSFVFLSYLIYLLDKRLALTKSTK